MLCSEVMMYTLLLLSAPSAVAAGFGGAHLGGTAELDANGAEFLLELDVDYKNMLNHLMKKIHSLLSQFWPL